MAGNDQGRWIRCTSARDCSRRFRLSDRPRDFGVGACLAEQNLLQLLPYSPLECRRPYIERQFEIRFATIEIRENGADPRGELAAPVTDDSRGGELGDQLGLEHCGVVAEGDAADAALGCRNEQAPQGCWYGDVGDADTRTAAGVRRGRHAELLVRMFVDTARRAIPSFIECGTHVLPPFQFLFEARGAVRLGVGPRRDPQNSLECAREPAGLAQRRRAGSDRASSFAHQRYRGVGARRVGRMTAAARAEPLALGSFGDGETGDLGPPWA